MRLLHARLRLAPSRRPLRPAAGVGIFGLKSSHKVTAKLASPSAPWGYSLCLVNLVLDGYTNAAQDEIHKRYHHGSALQVPPRLSLHLLLLLAVAAAAVLAAAAAVAVAAAGWQ